MARSLLHRARTTATRILAVADDPATTPYQLLTGSRRALADLNAVRARRQHATAPAPPHSATPARRAPPAVRASPAPAGGRPLRGSISR
ncbi:hypothetical protein [Streptomyces sp. sk226]|uniref:hypothetical protein n=1 Tax=Streptomyces sp. sk226 TaxID=2034268 RepID=UPI00211D4E70|nr:hypothetical protein [Streptomyces sp. sk226]